MLELNETRVVKIHIHSLDTQAVLLHGDRIELLRLDGRCLQNTFQSQTTYLYFAVFRSLLQTAKEKKENKVSGIICSSINRPIMAANFHGMHFNRESDL